MSTRSTSSNLYSPLRDPESLIQRRNLGESSSLFDFEEVMSILHDNMGPPPAGPPPSNYNGPPPVVRPNGPGPRSMEELCQPSINGRGRPIAQIPIQATDFGLHHHMIQQVQNTCQFHGLSGDDANRHIDKFLEICQHMKQNGVSDDALHLSLFPYSLTHQAIAFSTRSGVANNGPPTIPPTHSPLPKEVERENRVCQKVLGFWDNSSSGNPTPSDPTIASSSPSFTPFEGGDFILEEIETFYITPEAISNLDYDYYDTEGDILYLEKLLNEDPSPTLPPMKNDDLKQVDVTMTKPSNRRNEYYCFLDGFSGYFQIPIDPQDQEKTTFTCPYRTFAYRRMPFGLCNASGHVLKVHDGHFPRYDRGNNGSLHGRFLGLRGFFLVLPFPFRQNAKTVRRNQLSSKLGEVPFHG
ncbi:hypothetical protein Tco_0747119 [Tanacetum coccineum]